jgi:hypothetical protein
VISCVVTRRRKTRLLGDEQGSGCFNVGLQGEFDSNVALMSRLGLRSSSSPEGTGAANTFAAIRKPLWRVDRPTRPERGQSRHTWFGWAGESHRQRRMRRLQCGRSGRRHIEPGHLPILRAPDISGGHAHSASRPARSSIYMVDCPGLPPPRRREYGAMTREVAVAAQRSSARVSVCSRRTATSHVTWWDE